MEEKILELAFKFRLARKYRLYEQSWKYPSHHNEDNMGKRLLQFLNYGFQ